MALERFLDPTLRSLQDGTEEKDESPGHESRKAPAVPSPVPASADAGEGASQGTARPAGPSAKRKIAFCLFKFFPYGGLGRDFLRIARECVSRGHEIHVFTMEWPGEMPTEFRIHTVPTAGVTNRSLCSSYSKNLKEILAKSDFDSVVGFNRMPGLDIYYAADVCHAADVRAQTFPWLRFTPRHRLYSSFENQVFRKNGKTEILLISEVEKEHFKEYYGTEERRFHFLPPGVTRDRIRPDNAEEIRTAKRAELGLNERDHVLLLVGSNWKKKGLDRALRAVAALPTDVRAHTNLLIFGKDKPRHWQGLTRKLGIDRQIRFMGLRNDVPQMLLAADLLLHPAYRENTGTVLLEATVSGLPVLASEACGYAFHITESNAGLLVPAPFRQEEMNQRLRYMLTSGRIPEWRERALQYMRNTDLFSLKERAVDCIESITERLVAARQAER